MKWYYNYQFRQWLVTQIVSSHCPNWELNIFYSYHRYQQHIMYVSFQVMSIINDYWFIHRIPVSFSGASTYNKLSRIMMLCCCTHNSLVIQWVFAYLIKSAGNWYINSERRCRKTLRAPNVRFGKTFIRSRFLVSISYKLLLYWNIDRKQFGSVLFENLYQNFVNWTSNISVIFIKCKSLNTVLCAHYIYCW